MKRIRKPNEKDSRQFYLFEMSSARQIAEVSRTKPRKKPVEASKPARLTSIPPPPVEPVKQPENSLKTEIPDREELRRLWKVTPEALHTLSGKKTANFLKERTFPMYQRRSVPFSPRGGVKRVKACKNVFYTVTF